MSTVQLTPVSLIRNHGRVYAARALDGVWAYRVTGSRWEVTHREFGRRVWAPTLDAARAWTADPTFVARLLAAPPDGKVLARAEYAAIRGELTAVDVRRMLQAVPAGAVETGIGRVRPGARLLGLAAADAVNVLGVVYGTVPGAWLGALRVVRPELVPLPLRLLWAEAPGAYMARVQERFEVAAWRMARERLGAPVRRDSAAD